MDGLAIQLELHRTALTGHCYRMLGSEADADDAVQEAMVKAWRHLNDFAGRSSLRTWLYRIATRVCLDQLSARKHRVRPMELGPVGTVDDSLEALPDSAFVEPIPDGRAVPSDADPAERAMLRQSIRLAFVAALQHLPPKQRAVLLLVEVLGWSAAEVAEGLDTTVASVNSALQRARTRMTELGQAETQPLPEPKKQLLDRYVDAFERYDVDALTALLHEDATFSMPPYSLWLRGPESVRGWLLGRGSVCRGSRLLPTEACGSPAFGQYHPSPAGETMKPWALIVLETNGEQVVGWNSFLDTAKLFPRFGLPMSLTG